MKYTDEQRQEAMRLVFDQRMGKTDVAQKLKIPIGTLGTWVTSERKRRTSPVTAPETPVPAEVPGDDGQALTGALVPASVAAVTDDDTADVEAKCKLWKNRIHAAMAKTVASVINVGRELAEAREDIPSGAWLAFLEHDIGMNDQVAREYLRLAGHKVIANPSNYLALPPSPAALLHLSRIEPESELQEAIDHDRVYPGMTIADCKDLRNEISAEPVNTRGPRNPPAAPPLSLADAIGIVLAHDPAAFAWRMNSQPAKVRELMGWCEAFMEASLNRYGARAVKIVE